MAQTTKQLAGNQRRTLRSLRQRLLAMSAEWDGIDQFNLTKLEELADQCEDVAIDLMAPDDTDRGR